MKTIIPAGINPDFLKLFREAHGLSQREFAQKIKTTAALVSRYETGLAEMSTEFLNKLCAAFGYEAGYFTQTYDASMAGLIHHRKRVSLSVRDRSRLEAEGRLRFMDVTTVARKCARRSELVARQHETPADLARKLRTVWGLGDRRMDNLVATLEEHGIFILTYNFGTDKIDGFHLASSDNGVVCIVINEQFKDAPDRVNFSIAHELGHVLMHQQIYPSETCENEANEFASAFLLPEESIRAELQAATHSMYAMEGLKAKWRVSIAALLRRAKDLEILTPSRYRSLCVWMSARGYRTREPSCGLGAMSEPRLFCRCTLELKKSGIDVPELLHQSREMLMQKYRHKSNPVPSLNGCSEVMRC